jgi:hypothetical protein
VAKEIDGPTGKMPAGRIIGQFVTMDVLVHTWDLARTIGADERLDEDSVRSAYEALKPMDADLERAPAAAFAAAGGRTSADVSD